jgi:hypothetical protein
MRILGLLLALAGAPKGGLATKAAVEHGHVSARPHLVLDSAPLTLDVAPAIDLLDAFGRRLGEGLPIADALHLGVEGQPATPFLSPFFYAQEIRDTRIDVANLASQIVVTARVTF